MSQIRLSKLNDQQTLFSEAGLQRQRKCSHARAASTLRIHLRPDDQRHYWVKLCPTCDWEFCGDVIDERELRSLKVTDIRQYFAGSKSRA